MRRLVFIGALLIWVLLLWAQGAPTPASLPDFSGGSTCTICWELPDSTEPYVYHIQSMRMDGGETEFPPELDDVWDDDTVSIFPIALGDVADNCFIIGLDGTASRADDPRADGGRYCYRIRYKYSEDHLWSDWSDAVCSRQDNSAPIADVPAIRNWTIAPDTVIGFTATDAFVNITGARLYFRTDSSSFWELAVSETTYTPSNPLTNELPFNSADHSGDSYYEFYVAPVDELGNETSTLVGSTPAPAHTWTRFDTAEPTSNIDTAPLDEYYIVRSIEIPFTADDTYSGIDKVRLWYELSGSPHLYDSLSFGGDSPVTSSFSLNVVEDGAYELYTIAIDSAGNVESSIETEVSFFIDTQEPLFTSTLAEDTTTTSHRYDVTAEPGYSNDNTVFVTPVSADDPAPASEIESVYVAEGCVFELDHNLQVFEYIPGAHYEFNTWLTHGEVEICVQLKDVAGNFSTPHSQIVSIDTIAPLMRSVTLHDIPCSVPTDTTFSHQVEVLLDPDPASTPFYRVFMTQNESDLENIPDDEWLEYEDTLLFTFEGIPSGSWMTLWTVIKDSAGNVSNEVLDSVFYLAGANFYLYLDDIFDINGPDFSGIYTNDTCCSITVTVGADVDTVVLRDDYGWAFSYPTPEFAGIETTYTFEHCFSSGDGIRMIFAEGISIHDAFPTDAETLSIILDQVRPSMCDIIIEDISTGYDPLDTSEIADAWFTNNADVRVLFEHICEPDDDRTGIYFYRIICSSLEDSGSYADTRPFTIPDTDGSWDVWGYVQDSAGNWSLPEDYMITLDTHRPTISSVALHDTTSDSPTNTDELTIRVEMVASDEPYPTPAYVAFFETASQWPENLSDLWLDYEPSMFYSFIDPAPGTKTLYVAVKDNAGNISVMDSAKIEYITTINIDDMIVFDRTRGHSFTTYTKSRSVGINFETVGSPAAEWFATEDSTAPPVWLPLPDSGIVTFEILSPDEGEKIIYGWVRSVSSTVSPMVENTIIFDETMPELAYSFNLWDTTSAESWPNVFKAHMGWANELQVYGSITEATDNLSGVDSLRFLGPFEDFIWGTRPFDAIDGGIRVIYPMDSVKLVLDSAAVGSFNITGGAVDGAGNWNDIVVPGGYDTEAPIAEMLPFEHLDPATLPETIPMSITDGPDEGHLWKVCFKVQEWDYIKCAEYSEEWGTYPEFDVDFPLADTLDPAESYVIEIVVVDSAGNPSFVLPWILSSKLAFKVVAPNDITDSDFTNMQTVLTIIDFEESHEPDSMRFAETRSELLASPWKTFTRTDSIEFGNPNNQLKYVYAQTMSGIYLSPVNVDSIYLDTIPPTIERIDARDPDSGEPNWSTQREIELVAINPQDTEPGYVYALRVSESPNFDYNVDVCLLVDNVTHYEVSDIPYEPVDSDPAWLKAALLEGKRVLFIQALDRAENPSGTKIDTITIYPDEAEVINFPNPFNPNTQPTQIRLKSATQGGSVDINIYDMFGNPVWDMQYSLKSDSRLGQLEWDGKNTNGDIVGNGGYICIVDFGDKVVKRKIAVWKGE